MAHYFSPRLAEFNQGSIKRGSVPSKANAPGTKLGRIDLD
jgi:hypothetical protein